MSFSGIEPRKNEKSGHQMLQACDFLQNAADALPQFLSGEVGLMGKLLQLAFDHGKRRAKLVGCISQKPARRLYRIEETPEHGVERNRESFQRIAASNYGKALRQIL